MKPIRKVAVLGSGVMGSAIAAHFANAGVPAVVLDIVPPGTPADAERKLRDRFAAENVARLSKTRPAPLFSPRRAAMIEVGNLDDDLAKLEQCDWVIEVVREDLEIKRGLYERIAPHVADGAIVSSNTSGLSLQAMADALPASLRPRFLGTHFFNPPRYMQLLELIPTPHTDDRLLEQVAEFATVRLGKGVVHARDTPNFIANRIGVHSMMVALRLIDSGELSIEAIDAVTGPAMGRPKTATFKLADLVGLDTLAAVAETVRRTGDESVKGMKPSPTLTKLVAAGALGRKTGAGFYKKERKGPLQVIDIASAAYREPEIPPMPELKELGKVADVRERVRRLVGGDGAAAAAAWACLAPTLSYSAMRLGEIADDAATIDRAMRLGFNWELGPFEAWDALGFVETAKRLRDDGYPLPAWVEAMEQAGETSLYTDAPAAPTGDGTVRRAIPHDPRRVDLDAIRAAGGELRRNDSASLLDLGDDVLCLEFHTKMNAVDNGTIEMMLAAADEAESNWRGLVVANQGGNFCAGANLMLIVQAAEAGKLDTIETIIRQFQLANDRLEQCRVPTVVAPHGMALGGGAEVVLAGNAVQAAAESYVGLVELGAGVIPGGGGCMRLYRRHLRRTGDAYVALKTTFETIGKATVSTSAEEAQALGFLGRQDAWSMQGDFRIADAKAKALAMAEAGWAPEPAQPLEVMGASGAALIGSALENMLEGRYISEHDRLIGRELASILSGGGVAGPTKVSEQHLLDLECESFLRLCGEAKTRERMVALLKTGKPLRN